MKILKLKLNNFKKFDNQEFLFNDHNQISGSNGSGKSSIKEAIVFCLYNRTLDGSSADTSKFIKDGEDKCTVEMDFSIGGETYKIRRERTNNKTRILFLDGSQSEEDSNVTQRDLSSLLPDYKVFLSVFNIGFFMSMEDKEKREFILSHTPKIDILDIFKKMTEGKSYDEYDLDFNNLSATHKKLLEARRTNKARIDFMNAIIEHSKPIEIPAYDKATAEKVFNELELLKEKKRNAIVYEDSLAIYQNELLNFNQTEKRNTETRAKIAKLLISDIRQPDNRKLTNLIAKKNELKKLISIPETKCPTCLQEIDPTHKAKIDDINDKNAKIASDTENEIKQERNNYNEKNEAYRLNESNKEKIKLLSKQIVDDLKAPTAPKEFIFKEDELYSELEEKIEKLKADKIANELAKKNEEARISDLDQIKTERISIIKSIEEHTELITIFSPKGIRAEEMRLKLAPIIKLFNDFIPNSEIKTLQILKNELDYKEVFNIYIDNKEYSKMSLGEKTRVDLALSRIINKLTGEEIDVYFLDNAEVLDEIQEIPPQSFTATVDNNKLKIN